MLTLLTISEYKVEALKITHDARAIVHTAPIASSFSEAGNIVLVWLVGIKYTTNSSAKFGHQARASYFI
jgi:hypothetical protein